jgi:hypothetical protein
VFPLRDTRSHLFLRRLAMPVLVFEAFCILCVRRYMRLEGLRWQEACFGFSVRTQLNT